MKKPATHITNSQSIRQKRREQDGCHIEMCPIIGISQRA